MMDDGLSGYYRWHVFIRALVLDNGKGNKLNEAWLPIDRHVGLASAIHYKQQPRQSHDGKNPNNPEIDPTSLERLRNFWVPMNFEQLDDAFDEYIDYVDIGNHTKTTSMIKKSTHQVPH